MNIENAEQLEDKEGEYESSSHNVKLFDSVNKLAHWLLFAKPETFVVQTGHRQDDGKKVYQIQYERKE